MIVAVTLNFNENDTIYTSYCFHSGYALCCKISFQVISIIELSVRRTANKQPVDYSLTESQMLQEVQLTKQLVNN